MHSNKHILVIDDEQVVLDAVKKILLSENFNVDLAKDATSDFDIQGFNDFTKFEKIRMHQCFPTRHYNKFGFQFFQ